jgi:hypothetical protein
MPKINIDTDSEIAVIKMRKEDFISLTDIAHSKMEEHIIIKWLSLKSTIEYIGEWEALYNPDFNYTEFGTIKNSAGSNNFVLSVKLWIAKTNAIGISALFGMTAKEWRDKNPKQKGNIRDYTNINGLICLSNMENINAVLINEGVCQRDRLIKLNKIAIQQKKILEGIENRKLLR